MAPSSLAALPRVARHQVGSRDHGNHRRPARGRRRAVRRSQRPRAADGRRLDLALDLCGGPPPQPDRGMAPAGARAEPGRSRPHLVPVDARPPRRLLRGDVRGPRVRPARRPDGAGYRRPHRRPVRRGPPAPRQRSRRPRPARGGARALPDVDRRGPVRRARRHVPARLGGAARGLAAPEARRHLRARVHLGHDRQPQGRDPHPRERAGRGDVVPRDHQPDGAPDRVAAPPVPCARAGRVAVLRAQRRRRRAVRAKPEPAGDLRLAPRAPGHEHGPRARRCSTCSGARSSARSRSRARPRRSPACDRSAGACRIRRDGCCSAASTRSSAAGCGCSRPPARSCRPRSSRRGRTWASSSSRATARPRRSRAPRRR